MSIATAFTLLAALLMRIVEPHTYKTYGEACWWAVQTVSTVGYGDNVPTTGGGRLVATAVMIFGIALIPAITSLIVAVFMNQQIRRVELPARQAAGRRRVGCSAVRPVIDGHNDVLSHLAEENAADGAILDEDAAAITVPRARAGGLAAGMFAVLPPTGEWDVKRTSGGYEIPYNDPVGWEESARTVGALGARLFRLLEAAGGQVRLIRDAADLDTCLAGDALGVVFHFEGAEPIDAGLDALEIWYAAGLRSLGIVWSRANAFASGVPFKFPSTPDTGPGLTEAGERLVRRCAELGIAVDLSHLNAAGFWDVARVGRGAADRQPLRRLRAVHVQPQPDGRPARRDRVERRARRDQLRRRLTARRRRRRRRHAAVADRRARPLRGRPLRRRARRARVRLRRRDDARRRPARRRLPGRPGRPRGRRVREPRGRPDRLAKLAASARRQPGARSPRARPPGRPRGELCAVRCPGGP